MEIERIINRKAKKILEITSYPPPRAGWGVRVSFLKSALIGAGHICEVLNISPFSRKIRSAEYLTSLNGLDFVTKILIRCLKGYKVHMHMNGDSPKGFILAALAEFISLLTFKRPILTFHAGPYQKYFPQDRAPFLTPLYKFIFHAAGKIICNNEIVKDKIAGYGIKSDKIFPIQAFSVQYLKYHPDSLNDEINTFLNRKHPVISTYVFFRPEFFIDKMIKAIEQAVMKHPNLGLLIIGHDQGSDYIKKLLSDVSLNSNVLFAGDQSHDAFLTLLSKSDIYLRTPVKDGICSSVLEALSLGIPVVASENNRRPASVITYNNDDLDDMVKVIDESVQNLHQLKTNIIKPIIQDTVKTEVELLIS